MRRILTIFLSLILAITFVGCKSNEEILSNGGLQSGESQKFKDYMTLLYSASDSFNPYEVKTDVNRQLCMLLYEPLVKTDNEFNAVKCIASSVEMAGNVCTVKLKDVLFSDGSKLTAEDVIHSFNLAKASQTEYASKLYEVVTVSAGDSNTVIFNLNVYDPYFKNVLDFPVIKKGSEAITDSDSVKLPPISCGRYKVSDDLQKLVLNENYFGEKSSIKEIRLINAPGEESVSHYVEIGATDMYYSNISDGNILRMSGQKIDINLNNLVYLGVNLSKGNLGFRQLRQAISSGIDREKICKDVFYNNALAANGFYNPAFADTKSVQNIQTTANSQITIENLNEIGYNSLDKEGFYRNNSGALRFNLIVNTENRIRVNVANEIARQLASVGIKLNVTELSFADYSQRLASGDFDFYLAEVNLSENMDMRPLVLPGGSMAFGINGVDTKPITKDDTQPVETASWIEVVNKFYTNEAGVADVATVLQTDMPIIPICYRTGILFCNDNIENINNSSKSDIYFSIESYKFKLN